MTNTQILFDIIHPQIKNDSLSKSESKPMATPRPTANDLREMSGRELINALVRDKSWAQLYRNEGARRAAFQGTDPFDALTGKTMAGKSSTQYLTVPDQDRLWAEHRLLVSFDRDGWDQKMREPVRARQFILDMSDGEVTEEAMNLFFPFLWKWYKLRGKPYRIPPVWSRKFGIAD